MLRDVSYKVSTSRDADTIVINCEGTYIAIPPDGINYLIASLKAAKNFNEDSAEFSGEIILRMSDGIDTRGVKR